jgi:intracellular sulfur oxidation DsrE/DsrF family protein
MRMKKILTLIYFGLLVISLQAQTDPSMVVDMDEHKIVIQLTSADTTIHKMLMKQLNNILVAAPNSRVEVVCLGPGIDMLTSNKTRVQPKLTEMKSRGIEFLACENTLREFKLSREEIVPESGFVKAGIIEIVQKQEEGWSYIRAGQ